MTKVNIQNYIHYNKPGVAVVYTAMKIVNTNVAQHCNILLWRNIFVHAISIEYILDISAMHFIFKLFSLLFISIFTAITTSEKLNIIVNSDYFLVSFKRFSLSAIYCNIYSYAKKRNCIISLYRATCKYSFLGIAV